MKLNEYNCAVKHFLVNDVLIYNLLSNFEPFFLSKKRNYFLHLTTSIIGQQLSVKSASVIINRYKSFLGTEITPEKVVNTETKVLRSLGLSNAKVRYIKDLANKLILNKVQLRGISNKTELEIMKELTKVKGIGTWTVHMFLIFVLGRKNILPVGDLGIKKAIMLNYNLENLPTGEKVLEISENNNWSPHNSYASLILWKSIGGN